MASIERRISALGEIGRILKTGGKAMVTSWATDQSGNGGSNYVKKIIDGDNGPKSTPLPIHKGTTILLRRTLSLNCLISLKVQLFKTT